MGHASSLPRRPLDRERMRTPRDTAVLPIPAAKRRAGTARRPEVRSDRSPAPLASPEAAATSVVRDVATADAAALLVVRVAEERFALELQSVDEAIESPALQPIPDMAAPLLGLLRLRDHTLPVYAPDVVLGVPLSNSARDVIVVRAGDRRIGLAVDAVEDAFELAWSAMRAAPGVADSDGVLRGVVWRDAELIAVLDARALIAACGADVPGGAR